MPKPMSILSTTFGKLPGQTITEFATEVRKLKAETSVIPDGSKPVTSFHDFIEECGKAIGQEVDWSE